METTRLASMSPARHPRPEKPLRIDRPNGLEVPTEFVMVIVTLVSGMVPPRGPLKENWDRGWKKHTASVGRSDIARK